MYLVLEDRNNGFSVYKTTAVSIGPHASARNGLCLRMARRTRNGAVCDHVDLRRQSLRPVAWRFAPTRGGACARGVAELAPGSVAARARLVRRTLPLGRWSS
jgi:hypothetical protein